MIVCIPEKPSVAQDIAKVIGATKKLIGYFEGNGYQVTWTYGHLCCLKTPEEYNDQWKYWSLSSMPMIPERFGINLIADSGVKKQFAIIKKLFASADMIINCGDAGQEGELIQRWVMQKAQVKCSVRRLWISSLTEESIRTGFNHLKPQKDYDNLYIAGLARATGDWLLGMNATRLYTLKYAGKDQLLSIGRVQTPTLALIVQRQKEIDHFKPEPYWLLTTTYRGCVFQAEEGKYTDKAEATKALSLVQRETFYIDGMTQKKSAEAPPQLYDLTSLQVDCNKRYGYTAETTLKTIQSLYEKKLTTYPRVDTRYLSDDIYQKCPGIIQDLSSRYKEAIPLLSSPLRKSRRVFDTEKVTDHHAIIPTGKPASSLSEKEQKVYDLIVRRFICNFYEDCTFWTTAVKGHSGIIPFKATGKEIIERGWKATFANIDENDSEEKEAILPKFTEGEHGQHTPELKEKQTSAPKPYTEATLLRAMETAGKFVEDEELRAALKQNGIGRPSSRAGIIETLFKRQYIIRQKNILIPSPIGIALIETIKSDLLKSCELTGIWEKKLRDIEAGRYNPNDFMNELKEQLMDVVNAVMSDKESHQITLCQHATGVSRNIVRKGRSSQKVKAGMTCPLCGQGKIFKAKYNYRCSRWKEGCNYSHPFEKKQPI